MKNNLKIHLCFGLLLLSFSAFTDETLKNYWTGHHLHGSFGFLVTEVAPTLPNKRSQINFKTNPTFFYGYEYGHQFDNNLFLSGGLEWTIAYPRNFVNWKEKKTERERIRSRRFLITSWLQPLTHFRLGYAFNNNVVASLGLTYLWGLSFNAKFTINEYLYLDLSYIQWLDRLFGVPKFLETLLASFDAADIAVGIGCKF